MALVSFGSVYPLLLMYLASLKAKEFSGVLFSAVDGQPAPVWYRFGWLIYFAFHLLMSGVG